MRPKIARDMQNHHRFEAQRFVDDAVEIWRSVRLVGCVTLRAQNKRPNVHVWAARDGMRVMTDDQSSRCLLWLPDVALMPAGAVFGAWNKVDSSELVCAVNREAFDVVECRQLATTIMSTKSSILQLTRSASL